MEEREGVKINFSLNKFVRAASGGGRHLPLLQPSVGRNLDKVTSNWCMSVRRKVRAATID